MAEAQPVQISFEEGIVETVAAKPLGDNLYKLAESPLFVEDGPSYGDVVEAVRQGDVALKFIRIVEKAAFTKSTFLLSEDIIASKEFELYKEEIMGIGGMWERAMGGFIILHIPENSDFDAKLKLDQLIEARRSQPL